MQWARGSIDRATAPAERATDVDRALGWGDGVAGDRTLEGNEEAMKSYDQVIRLDMLRHANRHEGKMADQKSVVEFRENSRDVLAYWLADRVDQPSRPR